MKVQTEISLEKQNQRQYTKKTQQLKKKIKSGRISIDESGKRRRLIPEESCGLIYIGHLPHGFYEKEITGFFKQFGHITNVKVCRSKRTGNSKGFAYVEFAHPEVAKIAAETMNNYLMFKKNLKVEYISYEQRPKLIFHGKRSDITTYKTLKRRNRNIACKNKIIDENEHLRQSKLTMGRLQRKLQRIQRFGIDYDLKPVDVPDGLKLN